MAKFQVRIDLPLRIDDDHLRAAAHRDALITDRAETLMREMGLDPAAVYWDVDEV